MAHKGRRRDRDYTTEWAMAYSNRGVLRARSGDLAGAESDFRSAIALESNTPVPTGNMAWLKQQSDEVIAAKAP